MKSIRFRSNEEWESALLMLPENSFFTLLRSVFGNIKTPFNKQNLIHDLSVFLSKKEIQETIKNYINEDDCKVIAAISILEEPFPGELESFFGGEYSYAELHNIVLNLEERLIVYRFKDEGKSRLALNPVLAPVLKPLAENSEILFPSRIISESTKIESKKTLWNASFLACVISFMYDQHDLFKNQGGIRKKNLDESKRIFPDLKLEVLLGTFRALGLLQLDETGKHHIDEIRLNQLSELSDYERQIYLASSMMVFYELGENIWQYFNKNRIVTVAKELHSFFQSLNANRMYPKTTLYKLFEIQEKKGLEYFLKNSLSKNKDRTELALKVLQTFSLIEKTENNFWKINSIDYVSAEKKLAEKLISMDSPNSFIVFPEITFSEAIELARFSSVLETGTTTRFALTKDSVVRAYRLGITSDKIIGALKNLSGRHVDQNIIWQLKDWEKRYSEVTLHTGVVLSLSKDRLYLANTEPLASMIAATLVPGIFLLNVDDEDDAAAVLQKAGVDIIARNTIQNKSEKNMNGKTQSFFLNLDMNLKHSGLGFNDEKNNHQSNEKNIDEETSNEQKDRFRSILAKLKISKDQRDELSARIERRLILSDDQMNASSVKYEKLEARGLDYVGKYNISKQAISTGAILEVVWSDDEGVIQKIMGIPSSIEKINGEAVLVMHCKHGNNNQDNLIRIALGRISVLRRIKQSIFGE